MESGVHLLGCASLQYTIHRFTIQLCTIDICIIETYLLYDMQRPGFLSEENKLDQISWNFKKMTFSLGIFS